MKDSRDIHRFIRTYLLKDITDNCEYHYNQNIIRFYHYYKYSSRGPANLVQIKNKNSLIKTMKSGFEVEMRIFYPNESMLIIHYSKLEFHYNREELNSIKRYSKLNEFLK